MRILKSLVKNRIYRHFRHCLSKASSAKVLYTRIKIIYFSPMRFITLVALCSLLAACATRPVPAIKAYDARPHYPVTVIPLSPSLTLRHVARAEVQRSSRSVLARDANPTLSTYTLIDGLNRKLFTAQSTLSEPHSMTGGPQMWNYRYEHDSLTVFTSESRHTILIVEDSTTAIPLRAFLLLRQKPDLSWTWSAFDVPKFPRHAWYLDQMWPSIAGLSDERIWYHLNDLPRWQSEGHWFRIRERTWSQSLDTIKPGDFMDSIR